MPHDILLVVGFVYGPGSVRDRAGETPVLDVLPMEAPPSPRDNVVIVVVPSSSAVSVAHNISCVYTEAENVCQ